MGAGYSSQTYSPSLYTCSMFDLWTEGRYKGFPERGKEMRSLAKYFLFSWFFIIFHFHHGQIEVGPFKTENDCQEVRQAATEWKGEQWKSNEITVSLCVEKAPEYRLREFVFE